MRWYKNRIKLQNCYYKYFLKKKKKKKKEVTTCPGVVPVARVKRSASVPNSAIVSSGSTTLPTDFDIFRP